MSHAVGSMHKLSEPQMNTDYNDSHDCAKRNFIIVII